MKYLRAHWYHNYDEEPSTLYSELDDERYEVRKIEVFRNGAMMKSAASDVGSADYLSEKPIPSLAEINSDPQFLAVEITLHEFETLWAVDRADTGP